MGKLEKLLARLKTRPVDFTWQEFVTLLELLGYKLKKTGRTSGSRRKFVHTSKRSILIHEPHAGKPFKEYQIMQLINQLKLEGLL